MSTCVSENRFLVPPMDSMAMTVGPAALVATEHRNKAWREGRV